jgi:hypothetical protein
MHGDMVSLVALDLVLRLVHACVVCMAFVRNVFSVYFDYFPANVPRFRIPRHVVADFEFLCHVGSPVFCFTLGGLNAVSAGTTLLSLLPTL